MTKDEPMDEEEEEEDNFHPVKDEVKREQTATEDADNDEEVVDGVGVQVTVTEEEEEETTIEVKFEEEQAEGESIMNTTVDSDEVENQQSVLEATEADNSPVMNKKNTDKLMTI
jgi:hypothetical protein